MYRFDGQRQRSKCMRNGVVFLKSETLLLLEKFQLKAKIWGIRFGQHGLITY